MRKILLAAATMLMTVGLAFGAYNGGPRYSYSQATPTEQYSVYCGSFAWTDALNVWSSSINYVARVVIDGRKSMVWAPNIYTGTITPVGSSVTVNGSLSITGNGTIGQTLTTKHIVVTSSMVIVGDMVSSGTAKFMLVGAGDIISLKSFTSDGTGTGINIGASRGAANAPTIVLNGDQIGTCTFNGYDGANYKNCASISAEVDGTPSAGTDMPSRLIFKVCPDGSATRAEAMRINSDKTVLLQSGITASSMTSVGNTTIGGTLGVTGVSTLAGITLGGNISGANTYAVTGVVQITGENSNAKVQLYSADPLRLVTNNTQPVVMEHNGTRVAVSSFAATMASFPGGVEIAGNIIRGAVVYSTGSIAIVFTSSDIATGCVVYQSTITYKLPMDWIVKRSHILNNDASGSCSVAISTGDTIAGTFIVVSTGAHMSANTEYHSTDLNQWVGSKTIPAGKILKFWIPSGTQAATQSVTYILEYWSREW